MNIELPIQCKKLELSDREKIFAWMVLQVSKRLNTSKWTEYQLIFNKLDVNHILKRTEDNYLENLRKVFKIGVLNKYTVSVGWLNPKAKGSFGTGSKISESYIDQIEDPHFFVMYAYLLGRLTGDSNIFNDNPQTMYTLNDSSSPDRNIYKLYTSYYGEELYGDE